MTENAEVVTNESPDPQRQPGPPEPIPEKPPGFFYRREGRIFATIIISVFAAAVFAFGFVYIKLARMIDARLAQGPFSDTTNIYTAPRTVAVGDALTLDEVVARLRRAGYSISKSNPVGWYNLRRNAVEIFPGRDSYAEGEAAMLEFSGGKISRIISLRDNTARRQVSLEPQLIANLSGQREKRRLVRFAQIPPSLVHAVISAEDKHFFQHSGIDSLRLLKAAYVDLKQGRKEQGASTLTMQLARGFWLDPEKSWVRKFQEVLITMHLEHRLSKQQIFEDYANQVYLGRRGTFSISGFGEGARAYFAKDMAQLTIPEAALLAGMVQRPSYFNPYRYPDRARERRDMVLSLMRQNQYLTETEYQQAVATPARVAPEQPESFDHQYFVDLMNDELQSKLDEHEKHAHYIYTTLDPDLQDAAEAAVRIGIANVDEQLRRGRKKNTAPLPAGEPQVALIAVDPRTGDIKALVGGRNYSASQLNHVLAMRQPGSVFKPFVYTAALDTAIGGGQRIFTPASILDDSPTAFAFGKIIYQPDNWHHEFMGDVTLRTALAHSLNVATVELARDVGYDRVIAIARRLGLNEKIQPTPSVALGAYETTPLEIAGAYTAFANGGARVTPTTISLVRGPGGDVLYSHEPDVHNALDARVAYLMVNMMQEVLRSGTGAGVRARGFTLPAAGKTGTSRDGWFAGFTSELLCVVWVGFDDNRELGLEGARSALPIWTEFMKRAAEFRPYRDAQQFKAPPGIVTANICNDSGQLAGPYCPSTRSDVFIDGTQPVVRCELHALSPMQRYADRSIDDLPPATTHPTTPPAATVVTIPKR